jgi:hypothetical protein
MLTYKKYFRKIITGFIILYIMKTLYYQGFDASGNPSGNSVDYTMGSNGSHRSTVRAILERNKTLNEFIPLDQAYILFNTRIIDPPSSATSLSGITKKYRTQIFNINIENDHINCMHQGLYDTLMSSGTLEYQVTSANGRFKNVKRVVIDFNNYNGLEAPSAKDPPADWNLAPHVIYNRRIKFYSS